MHSEITLGIMDEVTSAVGKQFRAFKATVCSSYQTHELHQEVEARTRRVAKQATKQAVTQKAKGRARILEQQDSLESQISPNNVQRIKIFNFQTYKFHTLGDYVSTIRRYGTTDSYSTEPVRPMIFYFCA